MFHSSSHLKPEVLSPKEFLHDLAGLSEQYHELLEDEERIRFNPVMQLENNIDGATESADLPVELAGATEDLSNQIAKFHIEAINLDVVRDRIEKIYGGTLAVVKEVDLDTEDLDLSTYLTHSFSPAKLLQQRPTPPKEFKGVICNVLPDGSIRMDLISKHDARSRRIPTLGENGEPLVSIKFL